MQAVFQGIPDAAERIRQRRDAFREKRRKSQPVAASAGCVFKNHESIPAGQLVEELGMKDAAEGRARVSEIHGNFIVNEGGATATEVLALMDRIRQKARTSRDIELDAEVIILGEDEYTF